MKVIFAFSEINACMAAIKAVGSKVEMDEVKAAVAAITSDEMLKELSGAGWKVTLSGIEFEVPSEDLLRFYAAVEKHSDWIADLINASLKIAKLFKTGLSGFIHDALPKVELVAFRVFADGFNEVFGEKFTKTDVEVIKNSNGKVERVDCGKYSYVLCTPEHAGHFRENGLLAQVSGYAEIAKEFERQCDKF